MKLVHEMTGCGERHYPPALAPRLDRMKKTNMKNVNVRVDSFRPASQPFSFPKCERRWIDSVEMRDVLPSRVIRFDGGDDERIREMSGPPHSPTLVRSEVLNEVLSTECV